MKNDLLMNDVVFVKSGVTGGHYAIKGKKSKTAFQNKMTVEKMIPITEEDIVVDIGAYVGEYSLYASRIGAKKVISFEASPETFKVLTKNKKENMIIHNKAVVGSDEKKVELFLSTGVGATNSTIKTKSNSVTVDAINYNEAIKEATIVKIDVEGAEYTYDIVQPHLRGIILEVHSVPGLDWKKMANDIFNEIENAGFECLARPQYKNGFDMHSAWIRK